MPHSLESQLLLLFRATKQRLQAIAERQSLTFPQLIALFRLYRDGTMTMSDLSAQLGVTRGALTGLVDRLEENGLVARRPDHSDRRVIHLALTAEGRQAMADFERDWRQDVQNWLAPLDDATRLGFTKGLEALVATEAPHVPE